MNKLKFAVSLCGRHCRAQRGISCRNDGVCTGKKIKNKSLELGFDCV